MYDTSSKAFLIASLLDEIDFRDQRTTGHKDTQKINVLQDIITKGLTEPNFPSYLCQAFESYSNEKRLPQQPKILDDIINIMCKTLKLSTIQTVAVGFALIDWNYADSKKFLRLKLPEVLAGTALGEVNDDLTHGLFLLISSSEDLLASEISGVFMALVNAHPELSKVVATLKSVSPTADADLDMAQALSASTRQRMSVASILGDFGVQYSVSADAFRQVLRDIGIALDEEQVAEIIVSILARNRLSDLGDATDSSSQWNTDVIGEVLSEDCRGLNWTKVATKLDQPLLSIRSEDDFQRLARLFSRISDCPLPGAGLVNLWDNRAAQLALLVLSANAPRSVVDFSALTSQDQRIPGEVPFPPNNSWMCLSLYSSFIGLAHSGLALEVTEALMNAAVTYPEYIAVGLAQVQDPVSGVRAEVLRRTLPMFTGLPGSRPTSMAVMMKLQSVNPDLVILLTRIALKRASSKQEMVDIDSRLKSLGPAIIHRVEEDCLSEELLGYWCVKADKGELNLEEKIMNALERNPPTVRAFIAFAECNAHTLRTAASDGGLLSIESFAVLLRAAQVYPSIVSIDEVRTLSALMAQQQQNILLGNQILSGESAADAGSEMGSAIGQDIPRLHNGPESDEVEEEANAYFQKIYTSDITIADVIQLLKQFKSSTNVREQEVFRCMIHNLFDEYRFFHKYPDKELLVTGRLFGTLIQHQLISSITLGIALRYVLEALRKDPEASDSNEKMFRFGKISLEQFRPRLGEWPQYCSHLVQIPHLTRHCPELFNDAQRAINNPLPSTSPAQPNLGAINGSMESDQMLMGADIGLGSLESRADPRKGATPNRVMPVVLDASPSTSTSALSQQLSGLNLNPLESKMLPLSDNELMMLHGSAFTLVPPALSLSALNRSSTPSPLDFNVNPTEGMSPPQGASMMAQLAASVDLDIMVRTQPTLLLPVAALEVIEKEVFRPKSVIERMASVNVDVLNTTLPPESIRDQIHFIVNNIAKSNCEAKSVELRNLLTNDHFNWFANYLVVKRISTQPNLHSMYLTVLDAINSSNLSKVVLDSVYHNVTKLLQSPNITTSSSERSLLRNLGIWLGQTTLARNKPLLQRRVNLKELLFWGYGTGRLIAVCSFVARIIEGARDSKVFRPPNPWLMALLGVLREMYETEDLKMNIKFEVQVLCKNINIKIEDIQRTSQLTTIPVPIKDSRNPDFNVKAAAAAPASNSLSPMSGNSPVASAAAMQTIQQGITMPQRAEDAGVDEANKQPGEVAGAGAGSQEQTVIPNLAAYVTINPSLQFFATNPAQRRLVSLAVDRAIREIIQPVVERSVTIASVTTKQLILKDFSTEPNEQQLRNGAHLMISNLAGSLALVTCKEPLRVSIGNHLRSLLQQVTSDQSLIEQIVLVCSNDNLELGCMLIEKASTEKAIRDVDESLAVAIQSRRKSREANQAFVDTTTKPGPKYPRELPDALKPNMGGLHPQQLLVYEGFQRARAMAVAAQQQQQQQQQQSTSVTSSPASSGMQGQGPQQMTSLPPSATSAPSLTMSQALEGYQHLSARIDMSLKAVLLQAPGRDISIAMLAADHEILVLLRELVMVTQRTQPTVRNETAMTFCENLFKRMVESVNVLDTLRLEVMVGIIEALRDACGGAKKFAPDIVSWLSHYAAFNPQDETSRKMHRAILILLLRVKLIRSQEVDTYFAIYMDAGRNMVWVELALSFVRQCLAEGLAATYEFASTFETVSKMRPVNTAVRKQLQKWLTDLRTLAASKEEQKVASGQQQGQPVGATAAVAAARDASVREHVTVLLERWLRVWTSTNDQVFGQYLQLMHQYGVLKTEEAADRFFRIATELCAEACLNSAQQTPQPQGGDSPASALTYTVVDALSKLFLLLVRLADKEAGDMTVRVNLLSRILNAVARTLLEDHETKKTNKQPFDQRPYFRLLSSLAQDLGVPDVQQEPNPAMTPLLGAYSQVYLILQPSVVPGFAFAWLQLISHRCFMPQLLLLKSQKGWPYMHRLVIALLLFLQPFLKHAQLNDSIRKLYKGTLRVLLVLLHDFPEFLCDYYLSFCDVIPSTCVQLRNLILSAFPRSMRLPDPFTPNLKVDLLPEIAQSPRVLTDYMAALSDRGIRPRLDSYITSKQPQDLPSLLPSALVMPATAGSSASTYNLPLITSLVVYVGAQAIVQLQGKIPLQNSPAMDIFKQLVVSFDSEGRYHLFNAMANQLRYPNSHTHYFSCVLLALFGEADSEAVQEQITRVLLERLIVHRPHPWGLLITFIELIKNPRYAFWRRSFTHCAPELERVFESVARSCMGPTASATMLQQQLGQVQGQAGSESKAPNSVR